MVREDDVITWPHASKLISTLAREIAERINSSSSETQVLGILRGGYHPARAIAKKLQLPVTYFGVSFYDGQEKQNIPRTYLDETLEFININPCIKQVVVVDDISDTGETLSFLDTRIAKPVISATLFAHTDTEFTPDVFVEEAKDDMWIVFPWEIPSCEERE